MATSDILTIWNNAIGSLGVKTSIASLTEQSAEAAACALNYPTCVKSVLRKKDWNCVRRTVSLTDVSNTITPPARWAYTYSYPDNCLRIWRMEDPTGFCLWKWGQAVQGFEVAMAPNGSSVPTRYIFSNWSDLSAIFTEYTFDAAHGYYEALFDPALVDALSWALAAEIAGALASNTQLITASANRAAQLIGEAAEANANESAPNNMDAVPAESLQARGFDPCIWPVGWRRFG